MNKQNGNMYDFITHTSTQLKDFVLMSASTAI